MLIGLVGSIAAIVLWWRSPTNLAGTVSAGQPAGGTNDTPSAAVTAIAGNESADSQPDSKGIQTANIEQDDADNANGFRDAPRSPVQTAFEAEVRMLGPDGRGLDINSSSAVLTNKRFERYMDALAAQASREPLAADLTKLYSGSATDGARSVEGVSVRRVVCGLKVCLASGTAKSNEMLKPWQTSFESNSSAPTYDSMAVQLRQPDGSVEFRMVFSTDPASLPVYPNSGSPARH